MLVAIVARAFAADVDGSSDHPVVSRYSGSEIIGYRQEAFARYGVPIGPMDGPSAGATEPVEGRVTRVLYRVPEGVSAIDVAENYAAALSAAGNFETVWACEAAGCGATFRRHPSFEPELFVYALRGRVRDQRFLTVRSAREDGETRVSVYTAVHESPVASLAGRVVVEVDVVEIGTLVTGKVDADADAMARAIAETGRVALYGLTFDTGSATLTAASASTLGQIVTLMAQNGGLSLYVVGHTDAVGTLGSNLDLSRRRAEAVVTALVASGVARSRLEPQGVGPLSPVAENVTEGGKAENRRVELVAR